MALPYPFRVKEPVSQRMDRLINNNSFMAMSLQQSEEQQRRQSKSKQLSNQNYPLHYFQPIKPSKRHSLALGQIDRISRLDSAVKTNTLLKSEEQVYKNKQLNGSKTASVMSDRMRNILTWMPDQNIEWQDWMHESNSSTSSKKTASASCSHASLRLDKP